MRRTLERRAPVAVLAVGLLVSLGLGWMVWKAVNTQQQFRLQNAADRAHAEIDARIEAYVAVLRGAAGLFAASDSVTRREFEAYVRRLDINTFYPGVQGIGYSAQVLPAERETILRRARDGGRDDFRFWALGPGDMVVEPPPDRPIHAIVYLEPDTPANHVALGLDMSSEPARREAMERARDTGRAAATGRVRLVQEIDPAHEQAGFLVYAPVYRGGLVPATVDRRRAALLGLVYSPFRADDLFRGTLGPASTSELRFAVYDGAVSDATSLYRPEPLNPSSRFQVVQQTDVGGRKWTLVFERGPGFPRLPSVGIGLTTVVGCSSLTLALFLAMRTEVRGRRLAEERAEELRRSEEILRAANREKDEFLTVISHELRTPLNAILGWASMLRRGQVPPANLERALAIIERNALAQTKLVEDLLDTSRAMGGRLRLAREQIDIAAVLDAAVESIRPVVAAAKVALSWNRSRELGTMYADPARLQQIVGNLLSNAVKFTPAGGRITIDARRGPSDLTVRVEDTGVGIEPEFLPHVFDRFRQADTSTTRTHSGVGLGLAIVRSLVDLHGGKVEAFSGGKGKGATFVMTLPLDRRTASAAQPASERTAAG